MNGRIVDDRSPRSERSERRIAEGSTTLIAPAVLTGLAPKARVAVVRGEIPVGTCRSIATG